MPIGGPYQYVVSGRQMLTPTVLGLQLKTSGRSQLQHLPGQYAALSFNKNDKLSQARSFSIASAPNQSGTLEFGVRLSGPFTQTMSELKVGDSVFVYGPFGSFVWQPRFQPDVVFLAGGIGVTPFLSSIGYATDQGLTNNLTLLYSNRQLNDAPYLEYLAEQATRNPHFKYEVFFTQDSAVPAPCRAGRIDSAAIKAAVGPDLTKRHYFVCGPQSFMDAMIEQLAGLGVPAEQIFNEAFAQGPSEQLHSSGAVANTVYALTALSVLGLATVIALRTASAQAPATATAPQEAVTPAAQTVTPTAQVASPNTSSTAINSATSVAPTYVPPTNPRTAVS